MMTEENDPHYDEGHDDQSAGDAAVTREIPNDDEKMAPGPFEAERLVRERLSLAWFGEPSEMLRTVLLQICKGHRTPKSGEKVHHPDIVDGDLEPRDLVCIGPHPEDIGTWIVSYPDPTSEVPQVPGWRDQLYVEVVLSELTPL